MSRLKNVLEQIRDPSVITAINESAYETIRPVLKEALVNCPYALTKEEGDELEGMGISINPYASQVHTHAAAKAIENRMLEVVGYHLPKEPVTFMSLKRSKLRFLRRGPQMNDHFVNPIVEAKDLTRYENADRAESYYYCSTSVAYLSDSLHFLSLEELAHIFTSSNKLETLLATVVLPVEACQKRPSLYPTVYTINYSDDGFCYLPGNHAGGAYYHNYSTLQWLKIDSIECVDKLAYAESFTLTFQLIESLGANHLFIISKKHLITPKIRSFKKDSHVLLPQIFHPKQRNANKPIKKTQAMQLYLYCKSVKEATMRDIFAKIRQIVPTQEVDLYDPDELTHIANYFYVVSHLSCVNDHQSLLKAGFFQKLFIPIKNYLRELSETVNGKTEFSQVLTALSWTTFTYDVEPEKVSVKYANCRSVAVARHLGTTAFHQHKRNRQRLHGVELVGPEDEAALVVRENQTVELNSDNQSVSSMASTELAEVRSVASTLISPTSTSATSLALDDQLWAELLLRKAGQKRVVNVNNLGVPFERDRKNHAAQWVPTGMENLMNEVANCLQNPINLGFCQELPANYSSSWHTYQNLLITSDSVCVISDAPAMLELKTRKKKKQTVMPIFPGQCNLISSLQIRDCRFRFVSNAACRIVELMFVESDVPRKNRSWEVTTTESDSDAQSDQPKQEPIDEVDFLNGILGNNVNSGPTLSEPKATEDTANQSDTQRKVVAASQIAVEVTPNPSFGRHTVIAENAQDVKSPASLAVIDSTTLPWAAWFDVLKQHGFRGLDLQKDPYDKIIYPVDKVQILPHAEWDTVPDLNLRVALQQLKRFPIKIKVNHQRAAAYGSDIKNKRTGKLLPEQPKQWRESFAYKMINRDLERVVVVIHGAGGCGKSRFLQEWLNNHEDMNSVCTIVCPTIELRNDWSKKIPKLEPTNIKTFEKAMLQNAKKIVIFDDYSKLPAGFIEAYMIHHHSVDLFILTGDTKQSEHHERNREAYISTLEPATEVYSQHCEYYLNCTHRNVKALANKLGVYSEVEGDLIVHVKKVPLKGKRLPMLVPSSDKSDALVDLGNVSMTYAGCQGLTCQMIQVLIDNHTQFCSEQVLYTCLSRAVNEIAFINTGPNSEDFWSKLDSTPYLKAFIDNYRDEKTERFLSTPAPAEPKEPELPKTHLPVAPNHLLENHISNLREKHDREIFSKNFGYSNAIQGAGVTELFQHQQAKDESLLWATIEARLAISSPENNWKEFVLKKDIGDILFFNYHALMELPDESPPFEPRLWAVCKAEVTNTYMAKPMANLINAAQRQSPDFHPEKIALFLKSQWVKKVEKLGCIKVKPGQTIAAFMQETVMVYGTMARYLRKKRQEFQPKRVFINCEKTSEDFGAFIKNNWNFGRKAHTNDFTAFDQSQDGAMLQFEVAKCRFFNIPEDVIEGYIHIKLNAHIFLGTLSIMRLSGEGPTFDANTECSIAYTATRFHIPKDSTHVYAGDDMAVDCDLVEKKSFAKLAKELKLTSKTIKPNQRKGDWAEFCSWMITPKGIVKNPVKLNASLELAAALKKSNEVARSYALECKFAFDLRDDVYSIFTEQEMEHHWSCVRQLLFLKQSEVLNTHKDMLALKPSFDDPPRRSKAVKRREAKERKARVVEILPPNSF
uniref:RNA replication protein n=1 Tax=Potato aucuba mosaic virus TaxID=12182 RepID=A0A291FJ66_PAMV|nr:RNA-dependent RNA polymerase [Potato aucuba mosaic virus]